MNQQDKPDYKSPAYQTMAARWQKIRDLTDGPDTLRKQDYLPQHRFEHDVSYDRRKQLATLLPAFNDTIDACTGLVFREEPQLEEDVPKEIAGSEDGEMETEGWWENIDLAGTHGADFLKEAFECALRYGHAVILVDNQPPLPDGADRAQEAQSARRPYWVLYEPHHVLNPITTIEGGKLVCQQITFEECVKERDGLYATKDVMQYRTFYRENGQVFWRLERKEGEKGKETFLIVGEGATGLAEIPFDVIYGDKKGYLESCPPFWQLAQLNLAHFQKSSVYQENVDANQFNVLLTIGKDDDDPIQIGPKTHIGVPVGGDAKFISPSPEGPEIARVAMQDLQRAMAEAGFAILAEEGGQAKTAKEVTLEHSRRTSKLSKIVKSLKDCVERCLGFMAEYKDLGSGGGVKIGQDVEEYILDAQTLSVLLQSVDTGSLSRATWLQLLAPTIRKVVEEFDPLKEDAELKRQAESLTEAQAAPQGSSLDGGANQLRNDSRF